MVDGVPHVRNPAEPPEGVETMELEELWRAGGESDEETLFGVIVQAVSDEEGNLYLLDMQLSEVHVFGPDGAKKGTLSRQGEGPGEVRNPSDMFFMPDGSLGLVQTFPGKVIKVNLDGTPAGTITMGGNDPTQGGFVAVIDGQCRDGHMVFAGVNIVPGETQLQQTRKSFLASFTQEGAELTRYWEHSQFFDFADLRTDERDQYNVFPRRWTLGAEGRVYAATERDAYKISIFAQDGTLERVIEREFENRKRTEEEMGTYRRIAQAQVANLPGEPKVEIADTPEAIQSVELWNNGSIWVTNARGNHDQPEGIMATYDVFDPKGHFVKQVAVACDADGKDDALLRVGSDRMVLITGLLPAIMSMQGGGAAATGDEEPAPMEVVCYRIKS